jgi:transcriptional antiterminator Rof (Rho-off)
MRRVSNVQRNPGTQNAFAVDLGRFCTHRTINWNERTAQEVEESKRVKNDASDETRHHQEQSTEYIEVQASGQTLLYEATRIVSRI